MELVKSVLFVLLVNSKIKKFVVECSDGYLPECPSSDHSVQIPKKKLDDLFFVVYKKRTTETYRQDYAFSQAVKKIAKDPMIDWSKKTVLYAPGYMESTRLPFAIKMGNAYCKLGYNVFLLDTTHFTIHPYPVATRIARAVGMNAAKVLVNLTYHGLKPNTLEIVGFSLGAHIANFIGKEFQGLTKTNISRITAPDPAGPCFRNLPPSSRLDSNDANFVDVIHTNVDGFGGAKPWGHIDFYVNGGKYQMSYLPVIPCLALCNHMRAYFLWIEALERPEAFIGMKCDSEEQAENLACYSRSPMETNTMGLSTNKNITGFFLLNTANKYPYGLGTFGLSKQSQADLKFLNTYNSTKFTKL